MRHRKEHQIRNPKLEIRRKSEIENPNQIKTTLADEDVLDFVLLICFGFRHSDFGFRPEGLLSRQHPALECVLRIHRFAPDPGFPETLREVCR